MPAASRETASSTTARISRRPIPAFWASGSTRNRPDAGDRRPQIDKIAASEAAVLLGGDAVKTGMRDQRRNDFGPDLRRREIARKTVPLGQGRESAIQNAAQFHRIRRARRSQRDCHSVPSFPGLAIGGFAIGGFASGIADRGPSPAKPLRARGGAYPTLPRRMRVCP